jgi:glycosyltransferase involved in cell wall biosynthesis
MERCWRFASPAQMLAKAGAIRAHHRFSTVRFLAYVLIHRAVEARRSIRGRTMDGEMTTASSPTTATRVPVAVCTIAHNEEANIAACIESVVGFAAEMVILDAGSTDRTAAIVREYQARHPEIILVSGENNSNLNVNKMRSFEPVTQPWIFFLDSDERMTPALWEEIRAAIQNERINGYLVGRKNLYFGRWLRWGGYYPDAQPRLFRRGKGRFPMKHVHEFLEIDGNVGALREPFIHLSYQTVAQFMHKFQFYTTFQAEKWAEAGIRWSPRNHLKYGVVRPAGVFFRQYFLWQGFRNGFVGFFAAVMSAVYEFVAYAKLADTVESSRQG